MEIKDKISALKNDFDLSAITPDEAFEGKGPNIELTKKNGEKFRVCMFVVEAKKSQLKKKFLHHVKNIFKTIHYF